MVSAAYIVRPGRCALGPLEPDDEELARQAAGEAPALEDLFVLELHRGERPRLRRTRTVDEIGICLDHWGQAIQAIADAVLELVQAEDPAAADELARRRALPLVDFVAQEVEEALETPEAVRALQRPEKPVRVRRRRRGFPMT